jgi:hypothetical protein
MISAIGIYGNVEEAIEAEQSLPPGIYEVRIYTSEQPSVRDIEVIESRLASEGIDVRHVYIGGGFIAVQYARHEVASGISFAWLAILPLIIPALTIGVISLGIFKIGDISENLGKLVLITGGVLIILVALLRKPAERVITSKGWPGGK